MKRQRKQAERSRKFYGQKACQDWDNSVATVGDSKSRSLLHQLRKAYHCATWRELGGILGITREAMHAWSGQGIPRTKIGLVKLLLKEKLDNTELRKALLKEKGNVES